MVHVVSDMVPMLRECQDEQYPGSTTEGPNEGLTQVNRFTATIAVGFGGGDTPKNHNTQTPQTPQGPTAGSVGTLVVSSVTDYVQANSRVEI